MIIELSLALSLILPRDPWFGADKIKHFLIAAFSQSVSYSALRITGASHGNSLAGAWAATAALSVAKELYDRRKVGLFSVKDLVWDAAGAGSATALVSHTAR